MKKNMMHPLMVTAGLMFLISCNEGDKKTEETTVMNDSSKMETVAPEAAKPRNVMLMWHKVANFDKWLPGYEMGDSMREASGLHNYIIARGVDDPNMVMVAVYMDDFEKAKAFNSSAALKDAMQKSGVVGTPKTSYYDTQVLDTSTNSSTLRVMRMAKVKDFDTWRKAFDSNEQPRIDAGLKTRAIGYGSDDKHNLMVVYVAQDKKKADDMFNSQAHKDRIAAAGVEGTPETFWYTVAKKY